MSLSVLNSSEIANVAGGCCDRRMGIALSATVGAIAGMVVGGGAALSFVMIIGAGWFAKEIIAEYNGNSDAAIREIQAAANNMAFIPTALVLGGGVMGGVVLGLTASKCLR